MTDAQLSNQFVEVAISAPTTEARLSNQFVEVAIAAPTVAARQSNEFVEIASKWLVTGTPGSLPWDPSVDSTATQPGWVPRTPSRYARPVQVEDATQGLTGAELTDGRGILVWPTIDGEAVHFAIVPAPAYFIIDDIVPIGDVQTLMVQPAVDGHIYRATVARMGPDLFCTVMRIDLDADQNGVGITEVWKANSASNPTSWERWGDIQRAVNLGTEPSLLDENVHLSGLLSLLDNGRWLYVGSKWTSFLGSPIVRAGAWYSDNGGRAWVETVSHSYYIAGGFLEYQSEQLAVDPTNGYIYFQTYSPASGNHELDMWVSVDGGVSWVNTPQTESTLFSVVLNDGTNVWSMAAQGEFYSLPGGDDGTAIANWDLYVADWMPVGGLIGVGDKAPGRTKGILIDEDLYYFWADRVARVGRGWWLGVAGWG